MNVKNAPNKPKQNSWTKSKGCLIAVAAVAVVLLCMCFLMIILGFFLEQHGNSELARADKLWLDGQKAEAVVIYRQQLQYVDRLNEAEIYKRIIAQLHDSGDAETTMLYVNNAIKDRINLKFTRADLSKLLADTKQAIADERERNKPNREQLDKFMETIGFFDLDVVIADINSEESRPPWVLIITVNKKWMAMPYNERFEYAKTFRGAWISVIPPKPGVERFEVRIVDENGKIIGGASRSKDKPWVE